MCKQKPGTYNLSLVEECECVFLLWEQNTKINKAEEERFQKLLLGHGKFDGTQNYHLLKFEFYVSVDSMEILPKRYLYWKINIWNILRWIDFDQGNCFSACEVTKGFVACSFS